MLRRIEQVLEKHVFIRFLLSGALNSAATYALYLALLTIAPYRASYTISFCCGIVVSYELNRIAVFRAKRSLGSAAAIPLIYLLQYALGVAVLTVWVERLRLSKESAPIVSMALTIPLTFVLTRWAFAEKRRAPG